jgi:hypothetical protein
LFRGLFLGGSGIRLGQLAPQDLPREIGQHDRDEIHAQLHADDAAGRRVDLDQGRRPPRAGGMDPGLMDQLLPEQLFDQAGNRGFVQAGDRRQTGA